MSSIGAGSGPRALRCMLAKLCWVDVKRRRASASLSAATTCSAGMA